MPSRRLFGLERTSGDLRFFGRYFAEVRKAWAGEPGGRNSTGLPRRKARAAERV
jgi:hypothetical protein